MSKVMYKYDIVRSAKTNTVSVLFKELGTGKDRLLKGTLVGATKKQIAGASSTPNIVKLKDVENGGWRSFRIDTVKFWGKADADSTAPYRF